LTATSFVVPSLPPAVPCVVVVVEKTAPHLCVVLLSQQDFNVVLEVTLSSRIFGYGARKKSKKQEAAGSLSSQDT